MSKDPQQDEAPQEPQEPKIIKRYSNRKLYDTDRSKYVTLDEIARMIKAGDEIVIVDNETKEDLTSVTLTQIIYEEEKRESRMPLAMLRNLIQTGGKTMSDFFDKSVVTPVSEIRDSALHLRDAVTDSAKRMYFERKAEEFRKGITTELDSLDQRITNRITELSAKEATEESVEEGELPVPEPVAEDQQGEEGEEVSLQSAHKVTEHVELLRERMATITALVDDLERTMDAE